MDFKLKSALASKSPSPVKSFSPFTRHLTADHIREVARGAHEAAAAAAEPQESNDGVLPEKRRPTKQDVVSAQFQPTRTRDQLVRDAGENKKKTRPLRAPHYAELRVPPNSKNVVSVQLPGDKREILFGEFDGWVSLERITCEPLQVGFDRERRRGPVLSYALFWVIWKLEATLPREDFEWIKRMAMEKVPRYSYGGEVAKMALLDHTALVEVQIPPAVGEIGVAAFQGCVNLTQIEIPRGLFEVHDAAFSGTTRLQQAIFSRNLQRIGKEAFMNSGIRIVEIPHSIQVSYARDWIIWKGVLIMSVVSDVPQVIEDAAFQRCRELEVVKFSEMAEDKVNTLMLGTKAFFGCAELQTFESPSGLTTIGSLAFAASGLRSVSLSPRLVDLETKAFEHAKFLTSVSLPPKLVVISDRTFAGCTSLREVVVSSELRTLATEAFYGCTSLVRLGSKEALEGGVEGVLLPPSLRGLGSRCFGQCTSIRSATIPDNVRSLSWTFQDCTSLEEVVLPRSIANLFGAFTRCTHLRILDLPAELVSINDDAFAYCTSLERVTVPVGVREIGNAAFLGCASLVEVRFQSLINSLNGGENPIWTRCQIGHGTFNKCPKLTRVVLPDSVTFHESDGTRVGSLDVLRKSFDDEVECVSPNGSVRGGTVLKEQKSGFADPGGDVEEDASA